MTDTARSENGMPEVRHATRAGLSSNDVPDTLHHHSSRLNNVSKKSWLWNERHAVQYNTLILSSN